MEGLVLDASYGSEAKWFRSLVKRNNDSDDEYHFDLFSPVIIGRNVQAANDILHLNITSPYFILNILRGIATGWIFQLNGDATFSFCKPESSVDMIGLGVNSLGKHNNPLCWSIIPHQSESELTYTGIFLELQEEAMLLFDIH